MNDHRQCVQPCNGCPTPFDCVDTSGCAKASLRVPIYYVQHPDGTYSAANPQPRFVGPHTPYEAPKPRVTKEENKPRRSRVKLQPSPMGGRA